MKASKQKPTSLIVNIAAFFVVIAGVMYAGTVVKSLLMALFIAINLSQPVLWLQKKRVPKGLAIATVITSILFVIIVFGEIIAISLSSFSQNLPLYERNVDKVLVSVQEFLNRFNIEFGESQFIEAFDPSRIMGSVSAFLSDLGGVMGNGFTILFLALFLLFEFETIPVKLNAIAKRKESFAYLEGIGKSIRHYLSIKTITSAITGILIWLLLAILGVDYAVIWGLLAFLLNFIPNIGSFVAAVPAVLFALIQLGLSGFIWTVIIFLAVNTIIGSVVEPKMMGKGLGLSTFIVFLSLIFWGFVFGAMGMFLSVPLTMVFKIIFEQRPDTLWVSVLLGTEEDAQKLNKE